MHSGARLLVGGTRQWGVLKPERPKMKPERPEMEPESLKMEPEIPKTEPTQNQNEPKQKQNRLMESVAKSPDKRSCARGPVLSWGSGAGMRRTALPSSTSALIGIFRGPPGRGPLTISLRILI